MKLNIMKKLFLMAFLPIITLIIYSSNHLTEKYSDLQNSELSISKLEALKLTSELIHELQIERGISLSILNNASDNYFFTLYQDQIKNTDIQILEFTSYLTSSELFNKYQGNKKNTR